MSTLRAVSLLAFLAVPFAALAPRAADAEGAQLTGLMAPDLTFPAGVNGVEAGSKLSQYRGKVVWLKFWLRDCPRCRSTLPEAQRLHDLYGRSGLVVLTVVHQYGPDQVRGFLEKPPLLKGQSPDQQFPYTFRVASDPTGTLAQAYQVNHRPTDYLIGVDGRVVSSNSVAEPTILKQLEVFRKQELGATPPGLGAVQESVIASEYGKALRLALEAAGKPDAPAAHKEFAARVEALAKKKLEDEIEVANLLWLKKNPAAARQHFDRLAQGYVDTPLAARAKEAVAAFQSASRG
jgi:thiol-disulfide isomerase/thioredoxin